MATEPLPESLRRYVLTSVPSVPFVEALLLYRAEAEAAPGRVVPIELLARRLYVSERQAAEIQRALREALIVQPAPDGSGHCYAPPAELVPMLDELARYYRSHLVEVTALIHSRTGRMAQQFADAFKLRKD
jgi:hypothetical protein